MQINRVHLKRRSSFRNLSGLVMLGITLPLFGPQAVRAQDPTIQMDIGFATSPGCGAAAARAEGGRIQMDQLQRLVAKAENVTNVALDQSMLQLASNFMNKNGAEKEEEIHHLLGQLKGIYVKDFEFAKEGAYTQGDVDQILCQVQGHSWEQVVSSVSKEDHETDAVYVLHDQNTFKGLLIVSAEPKELAVVNIVGPISPQDLSRLQGMFGIPKMGARAPRKPRPPRPPR